MQKDTETAKQEPALPETDAKATSVTPQTYLHENGGSTKSTAEPAEPSGDSNMTDCDAGSEKSFEALIKGPYKAAFAQKVQGIINKRFKEIKSGAAQSNACQPAQPDHAAQVQTDPLAATVPPDKQAPFPDFDAQAAEMVAMGYPEFDLDMELQNPTFKALIENGVAVQTAYNALHFDEIMDGSIRYGASVAAKQLADSIRFKVGRPTENGLSDRHGYVARRGAAGLSPAKRRELARKALMGEEIAF